MVTVYSKPNCPQCNATIRQLNKLDVPFKELDARDNLDELKAMGFQSAPVVVVNGKDKDAWSGFVPGKIKKLKELI